VTSPYRAITLELLALDLTACTRCVGTLANMETALRTLQQVLQVTGVEVQVQTIRIASEEQARQYHFVTSPTIRINGRDIALETLESACDACTEQCGCPAGTRCRVWRYQGLDYTEAPVGLIVEAMLRDIYDSSPHAAVPVGAPGAPEPMQPVVTGPSACCAPAEQEICCEPAAKSACCRTGNTHTCGCQ
jgi:hypothetical protein